MHMRASQAQGMQIVDDATQQIVGFLQEPLIDPDTGRILGFFVLSTQVGNSELFLQSSDIASWGTRIHVLSSDRLGPPQEIIRLAARLADPRFFMGQRILVQGSKRSLGSLGDVQFNTRHFSIEWLFPRKFFFVRQPLSITDVLEVTQEAIWVQDPIRLVKELNAPVAKQAEVIVDVLPQVQIRKH